MPAPPGTVIYPRLQGRATPGRTVYGHGSRRYLAGSAVAAPHAVNALHYGSLLRRFAGLALRHPRLLPPLIAAAWRFRRRGWYRTPPFLPLPPRDYVEWRLHTAYGSGDALPTVRELERYLRWTSRMRP
jgi:hypothetical protein